MARTPSDNFDWTISEEFPEEKAGASPHPTSEAGPPAPARAARPRWAVALTVSLIPVLVLIPWLAARWDEQRTRTTLEQMALAAEPAPMPLVGVAPMSAPATIHQFARLSPALARVDVARQYLTPEGGRVTFAVPHFYLFANGVWQPGEPPDDLVGERRIYRGERFTLEYSALDADIVEQAVAPELERLFRETCGLWNCPSNATLTLEFHTRAAWRNLSAGPRGAEREPVLFTLLRSGYTGVGRFPALYLHGYPVDADSRSYYARTLSLLTLARLGDSLQRSTQVARNALYYGLLVRQAARLGLEAGSHLQPSEAPVTLMPRQLWDWEALVPAASPAATRRAALREGVTFLGRLLADLPIGAEVALFNALSQEAEAVGATEWIVSGLQRAGQSPEAILRRIQQAVAPESSSARAIFPAGDAALTCLDRPASLLMPAVDTPQAWPFFGRFPGDAEMHSWSPDGRYAALRFGQQTLVLDQRSRRSWWPFAEGAARIYPLMWLSNTVLAVQVVSADLTTFRLFDVASPNRNFPVFADEARLAAAPDGASAAVWMPLGDEEQGDIFVLSLFDGTMTLIDHGYPPVWSPGGRALAYLKQGPARNGLSLRIHNRDRQQAATVWDTGEMAQPYLWPSLSWSPTGQHIAVALLPPTATAFPWLGLINPVNGSVQQLHAVFGQVTGNELSFSSDGRLLALVSHGVQRITLFDIAAARVLRTLPQTIYSVSWAPADQRLLIMSPSGVFLLPAPANPESTPILLAAGACQGVWKPVS
jgi:hypothetical protein